MIESGQIKLFVIIALLIFILLVIFIFFFIVLYFKRQLSYKNKIYKFQSQFAQTLLQSQLEIQEQTLNTISQEIHDNIGQVLSLAKLNLGTMDLQKPDLLQQKIDDSKVLVGKAIQDLRDLSRSINTDYVQQMGLLRAIEYELELLSKAGKHKTIIDIQGAVYRLDNQKELILFRIVQEILNNVIKHANASRITVHLNYRPELFILCVEDNGEGFDISLLKESENSKFGIGIKNMHNRAKLIGAEYSINSSKGNGTQVSISLPMILNSTDHANN